MPYTRNAVHFDVLRTTECVATFVVLRSWGVVSGAWSTSGGTFNSTSTATAIATIDYYDPEEGLRPSAGNRCGIRLSISYEANDQP